MIGFLIILIPATVAVIISPAFGYSLVFGLGYDAVLVSLLATMSFVVYRTLTALPPEPPEPS
jgi:hypothetical protein